MSKLRWMCKNGDCEGKREGDTDFCGNCNHALRKIARDLQKPVTTPKPLKRTPVNKVSPKRAYETGRYTEARRIFLKRMQLCECCGDKATEVHHKKGRENDLLMEKKYWLAVCHGCHVLITEDTAWAIAQGYSISRTATKPQETTI